MAQAEREHPSDEFQQERDNPGSTGQEGAGDAGRRPAEAQKEKQPIKPDSLGSRNVEFKAEDE